MKSTFFIFLFLLGCSLKNGQKEPELDVFDKIFAVKKTEKVDDLNRLFGPPQEIKDAHEDPLTEERVYDSKNDHLPLHVFIDKKSQKVRSFSLVYWVNFDAYSYLKKRFKSFKWIETPVASKYIDVEEDKFQVKIPELGMSFEYDNQDPLRRPLLIIIK